MTNEEVIAPSLSTYQDESTFAFDKIKEQEKVRKHLGLKRLEGDELVKAILKYYSLPKLSAYLKQRIVGDDGIAHPRFKRITLQFPDSLICDSATIVHQLQAGQEFIGADKEPRDYCAKNCCNGKDTFDANDGQKIWILADTSYSSCCIDEVAAEHVKSDLVIHFGDACLNPVERLPSLYIFGKPTLDFGVVVDKFKNQYINREEKIILMANAPYTHHLEKLYLLLKPEYPNLCYADLYLAEDANAEIVGYSPKTPSSLSHKYLNRHFVGLETTDSAGEKELFEEFCETLKQYSLFHISTPAAPRILQLTTSFESVTTYDLESDTLSQGPFPSLMHRYRCMHVARTAGTVGLLVNTLSLANTKVLINKIGQKLKDAGKKHYVFVVGKPNVAKLANFENIDVWCVLGCDHNGIIIDKTNEYYKPIVTPYELLLSMNYDITWTGKWITDFNNVIQQIQTEDSSEEMNSSSPTEPEDQEDEPPIFSPVTGTYISTSKPLRNLQHLTITSEEASPDSSSNSLVKKLGGAVAIKNTVSTSAAHLQTRHWTGLGSDYDKDGDSEQGAMVEEGRKGIARTYDL